MRIDFASARCRWRTICNTQSSQSYTKCKDPEHVRERVSRRIFHRVTRPYPVEPFGLLPVEVDVGIRCVFRLRVTGITSWKRAEKCVRQQRGHLQLAQANASVGVTFQQRYRASQQHRQLQGKLYDLWHQSLEEDGRFLLVQNLPRAKPDELEYTNSTSYRMNRATYTSAKK